MNGQRLAYHEGGFTPFEIDATDAVHPGEDVLALRVTQHTVTSDNLDKMSEYTDFNLAGIIRSVYLFRVPENISPRRKSPRFSTRIIETPRFPAKWPSLTNPPRRSLTPH